MTTDKTEMLETGPVKNHLEIKELNGVFMVSSFLVDLTSDKEPLKLAVTLEKVPQLIEDGVEINAISIDRKSPKLQEMLKQAATLKEIPDREKPRKIMELLRSKVGYAYDNVITDLGKIDPLLAEWVTKNIADDSSLGVPITLSEIVDSGFGVCRHLSVAMLAFAKEAGMEGVMLSYTPEGVDDGKYLRNILRKDNGQPVFKMGKVGDAIPAHAWVELRTKDGEWIPVDPSAQLVGDSKEGMGIFSEANYRAISLGVDITNFTSGSGVSYSGRNSLRFLPGEAEHTGILKINTRSRYNKEDNTRTPRSYHGPLSFQVLNVDPDEFGLRYTAALYPKIIDVKVA